MHCVELKSEWEWHGTGLSYEWFILGGVWGKSKFSRIKKETKPVCKITRFGAFSYAY